MLSAVGNIPHGVTSAHRLDCTGKNRPLDDDEVHFLQLLADEESAKEKAMREQEQKALERMQTARQAAVPSTPHSIASAGHMRHKPASKRHKVVPRTVKAAAHLASAGMPMIVLPPLARRNPRSMAPRCALMVHHTDWHCSACTVPSLHMRFGGDPASFVGGYRSTFSHGEASQITQQSSHSSLFHFMWFSRIMAALLFVTASLH